MDNVLIFSAGILLICIVMAFVIFSNKDGPATSVDVKLIHFGAVILTGIGLIFLISMAMYYFDPTGSTKGKEIFDGVKTILPPIVTLILGYYFGKKKDS